MQTHPTRPSPPSRESIKQLALRDPVVAAALHSCELGRVTYVEALQIALLAIADQNAVLMARMSDTERQRLRDLRLGPAPVTSRA